MKKQDIIILIFIFIFLIFIGSINKIQVTKLENYNKISKNISYSDSLNGIITDYLTNKSSVYLEINDSLNYKLVFVSKGRFYNKKDIEEYLNVGIKVYKIKNCDTLYLTGNFDNKSFFLIHKK